MDTIDDIFKTEINPSESVKQPEREEKKGKIDPRKLIIYSEIMKPKFDE